jgi:hypothetical protein
LKTQTTPYFYIIKHIPTNQLYAGCKFGKNANPKTFFKSGGYFTSSLPVKSLIKQYGSDSFEVVMLLTEEVCGISVYEYETRFLKDNNIAKRQNWLNKQNNTIITYGTESFRNIMKKVFGVEYYMQSEENKKQYFLKLKQKYGFDITSTFQLEETKQKSLETIRKKYGENITNVRQSPIVQEKTKETLQSRYGTNVNNPMDVPEFVEKISNTMLERYGVKYARNIPGVIERANATRKKLQARSIVIEIEKFLNSLQIRAKDVGLHRQWKYISIEELEKFCILHKISIP